MIGGSAAGRRLSAPGDGTRPLADRVKEALFAILAPDLAGAAVLDLFAGSGAGGIEALSRGAARAVFVERDAGAIRTIETNLRTTGVGPAVVVRAEVVGWLDGGWRRLPGEARGPFDIVIVDPPYADTATLGAVLGRLGEPSALLREGSLIVSKHFWRDRPPAVIGLLASERERRFGETALTFHRRGAGSGEAEEDR